MFHFLYFHRVFLFDVMEKETGKYLPQDQGQRDGNGAGTDLCAGLLRWTVCVLESDFDHKPGEREDEKPETNMRKKEYKDNLS